MTSQCLDTSCFLENDIRTLPGVASYVDVAEVLEAVYLIPSLSLELCVDIFSKDGCFVMVAPPTGFRLINTVGVARFYLCLVLLFSEPKLAGQGPVGLPK